MTWTKEKRAELHKIFGPFWLIPERDGSETAHLVEWPDGRRLRVLPDGINSGQRRSRVVSEALKRVCDQLGGEDHVSELAAEDPGGITDLALTFVVGAIARADLSWEYPPPDLEVSIEEWLAEWLEAGGSAEQLLHELGVDGWKIVRKENA